MKVIYKSLFYSADKIERRYIRCVSPNRYRVHEVGFDNKTYLEYETEGKEFSSNILKLAVERSGVFPSFVEIN